MDIGNRIKRLRESKGLSQDELADMLEFKSRGIMSRIESGERDVKQNELIKLAKIFNTTFDYLLGTEGEITQYKREYDEKQAKYLEALVALNPTKEEIDEAVKYIEFQRMKDSQK